MKRTVCPAGVRAAMALAALALAGCSNDPAGDVSSRRDPARASSIAGVQGDAAPDASSPAVINPEPESTEDWAFNGKPGRLITTPHYRVFSTQSRSNVTARLPLFLESALEHYRVAITGSGGALEYPESRLDTYILESRGDWELLARQLLGNQAEPFLKIRRGGFAYSGRALLFDLGTADTLSVTAHEGWHQYTQRTFGSSLPVWLEEGIATYMEGHRWSGRGSRPTFLPWANVERFDQLRRASARGVLLPLDELLSARPQDLISENSSQPGLTYYAQVWALTHFLMEGESQKYRESLRRLVRDAADGTLERNLARRLGSNRGRSSLAARRGPSVFLAYFNDDLSAARAEFDRFTQRVVSTGSRQHIVAGTSPLEPTP